VATRGAAAAGSRDEARATPPAAETPDVATPDRRRDTGGADRDDRDDREANGRGGASASDIESIADAVVIKLAEPFFLCPPNGQIGARGEHGFGLYHHDTRFLSGYELRVGGSVATSLAATAITGGKAVLELTNPPLDLGEGRQVAKQQLGIRWTRDLHDEPTRLVDRLTVRNYGADGVSIPLAFTFAADFRDIFTIRGLGGRRPGQLQEPGFDGGNLVFRYDGADGVDRTVTIGFDRRPTSTDGTSCSFELDVPARGEASLEIDVELGEVVHDGWPPIERRARTRRSSGTAEPRDSRTNERDDAGGGGWGVETSSDSLGFDAALARSLDDLLTLRGELDGQRYYAAGVPWFSTLFGRDSLIAAYQTLAFDADVAAETLRLLAGRQGTKDDPSRDEEPGKILHELRIGELARLHEIPQTPYYGSIDSTPLFLILLGAHSRWTGSLELFRELRPQVDRALGWIDRSVAAHDRYLAYDSTTKHGLSNQGWKDSWNSIVTADGAIAEAPIALAEVQGYVYRAWRSIAELFKRDGDGARATELRRRAGDLQARFEHDFWSDKLGCYLLALGAGGAPCEVVASNAGQVLWSGIASPDHAAAVRERLLADEMFSGWGVRTLSADAKAFNPVGYHLGTVWPHDNGLIAEGFRRYRADDAADRVFSALVETSADFPQQRLPECFAGFDRAAFGVPVRYPVACHPQAWAAGAIPHLLTSTLGLVPDAFGRRLNVVRPMLPAFLEHLEVRGLRVGSARVDLTFERDGHVTSAGVTHVEGDLDVTMDPR
jgi:glycogen debranching enzyme